MYINTHIQTVQEHVITCAVLMDLEISGHMCYARYVYIHTCIRTFINIHTHGKWQASCVLPRKYTYMHTYIHIYIHIGNCQVRIRTYMHTYIHIYIHIGNCRRHVCCQVRIHTYIHTYIYESMLSCNKSVPMGLCVPHGHMSMHTYIHTYIRTYTQRHTTNIHTQTYTYIPCR